MGDHAFSGIFDRHDPIIRSAFLDLSENVGDGLLGGVMEAGSEAPDGGLMGESGFRTKIGDDECFFESERAGHDFPVNRAKLLCRHRAGVEFGDAVQDSAFAMRSVDFLAALAFNFANGQDMTCALAKESDELLVELINGFAMFGNVQNTGRMKKGGRRINLKQS